MRAIFKYTLPREGLAMIEMPEGARTLDVQLQRGSLTLWALVETERSKIPHAFFVAETGKELDREIEFHVATVQMSDGDVVHVFNLGEQPEV